MNRQKQKREIFPNGNITLEASLTIFDPEPIERILSYRFNNRELLKQALTHSSVPDQPRKMRAGSNDALATLGDAVLGLASAANFYTKSGGTGPFLTSAKGDLTEYRKKHVERENLATVSRRTGLDRYILLLPEQKYDTLTSKVLHQLLEAIIGAVFLDSDYETASDLVQRIILEMPPT